MTDNTITDTAAARKPEYLVITLGVNAEATPAFFAVVVIVICVMQAPKIHNLSANMKRKRALKAQAKAVAA